MNNIIEIKGPYIQLNQLLKFTGIISTGGEAKFFIEENDITLNDVIVFELRKKVRPGDILIINDQVFNIVLEQTVEN